MPRDDEFADLTIPMLELISESAYENGVYRLPYNSELALLKEMRIAGYTSGRLLELSPKGVRARVLSAEDLL